MSDMLERRLEALGDRVGDHTARSVEDVDDVYHRRERYDRRHRAGVLAAVVMVVLAGSVALATARRASVDSQSLDLGGRPPATQLTIPGPTATAALPTGPVAVPAPTVGPRDVTTTTTAGAPPAPGPTPASTAPTYRGYQLLYPFASEAEATAWLVSSREEGHQPWHGSTDLTALGFAAYVGFPGADQVFQTTFDTRGDAHVTVGFVNPNGDPARMAVVHLLRLGTAADAPWEAVGTDDTLGLTLETPRYGSTVTSPVTVGGLITGADESIVVTAHRLGVQDPVGATPGVPAGGDRTPWSSTVRIAPGAPGVVTIAAATGGHLAAVERFAVTGVQTGP
jgi:hypothetical protein